MIAVAPGTSVGGGTSARRRENQRIQHLLAALKTSSKCKDLEKGRKIHAEAVESGADLHKFVASSLVDMYAKCGCLVDARKIFDRMLQHDVVSWTALILGYARNGEGRQALQLYERMRSSGCCPNSQTHVAALKACTALAVNEEDKQIDGKLLKLMSLEKGMAVHSQAASSLDDFVATSLIDMYSKCGIAAYAREVFDSLPPQSPAMWTALMFGYAQNGEALMALELFSAMQSISRFAPVRTTYLAALKACSCLAESEDRDGSFVKSVALENGMSVHLQASRSGFDLEISVASALVDMYSKCGSLTDARRVFDGMLRHDVVSWNSMILAYARDGDGKTALQLFAAMQSSQGFVPVRSSFLAALEACIDLAAKEEAQELDGNMALVKIASLEIGMAIHQEAAGRDCIEDMMVANTLIDMYSKCGSMDDAQRVFNQMSSHNLVSWTVLMFGYCEQQQELQAEQVLQLFNLLKSEGFVPSGQAFVAALKACSNSAALETGKQIHGEVCRRGVEVEAHIATCLVDLYCKCGSMPIAQQVFDSVSQRGIEIWTAVISGYSRLGDWSNVLDLFEKMVADGVKPSGVTFLSVLTSCSRAGLVEEGEFQFEAMKRRYGLDAGVEHYHCMIDLLSRANEFDKALSVVERMPSKNALTWTTLLSASHKWKNLEVGERAFAELLLVDGGKAAAAAYVLMANLYAKSLS